MNKSKRDAAFSIVELLVVISVVAVLAALAIPAYFQIQQRARTVKCANTLRSLGQGILGFSQENNGFLPRSWHSAGANGESGWAASIAPYLGVSDSMMEQSWTDVFNRLYRSPVDKSRDPLVFSYALNVHFELTPNGDDYFGSPQTWRKVVQIPRPTRTVLLAQTKPVRFGDHLMCHQWSTIRAAENALNHQAHKGRSHFLFADGHVELLKLDEVFQPARNINRFNPALAN